MQVPSQGCNAGSTSRRLEAAKDAGAPPRDGGPEPASGEGRGAKRRAIP